MISKDGTAPKDCILIFVFGADSSFDVTKTEDASGRTYGTATVTVGNGRVTLNDLNFILSHIFGYKDPDSIQITTASKVDGFTDDCVINGFTNLLKEKENGKNFFESLTDSDNGLIITTAPQEGKNITNNKHHLSWL